MASTAAASKTPAEGCAMCAQTASGAAVWSDEHWVVSPSGISEGCFLLISKRHVVGLWNLSEREAAGYGTVLSRLTREIERAYSPERIYVLTMGEKSPHVHSAVLPRMKGQPVDQRFYDGIFAHKGRLDNADRASKFNVSVREALAR